MAQFPTPSAIETQYFQILKSIKPSLNTNDKNSDFVIRGKVFASMVSGLYGDQTKVDNDTYISSSRPEALSLKGADLGILQQPATAAQGASVTLGGTDGTTVTPGQLSFIYLPTGVLYTNTSGGTITGGVLSVAVACSVTGQIGNIVAPDTLTLASPPTGVNQIATIDQTIGDGADIETTDSYRARLLSREQQPPAGGNETDYPLFAFAADPSVRSAVIRRFGRGLGTVDVYITTGTTDIDTAVTQGLAIVRVPTPQLLATVQAYYNAHVPLTDCPDVFGPSEVSVDATVNVELAAGLTLTSVPADSVNNPLGLTVRQLIQREVGRAMYKLPVGGRVIPGLPGGYVTAADIEEDLDIWLSAVKDTVTGLYLGKIPILSNRQVQKLDPPNYDKQVTENQLAAPGTISVVLGV